MWLKIFFINFLSFIVIDCSLIHPNYETRESKIVQSISEISRAREACNFPTYRLPNDTLPVKYEITIRTSIHQGLMDFNGIVKIHIRVVETTNVITLQYRGLNIERVNLYSVDGILISGDVPFELIESREFLRILSPFGLFVGSEHVIEIFYSGNIRSDGLGIFARNYEDEDGNVHWYATTQFEIDFARHAMPCYDEPAIRAPMQLTIVHGSNYHAVSNTKVNFTAPFIPGFYQTVFEPTPPVQTYLLAFLVSNFKYKSNNDSRVEQKVYANPASIDNGEGDFALTVVGPILDKHEENLGVDYPLDKMDHVAVRDFIFGAMENIGMMNYVERALLYHPDTPASQQEAQKMLIIRIVAHEFAHQWAGNIVSPKWWSYIWLNEGIATLYDVYIPSLLYPEMNFLERFVSITMPRAFAADSLTSSWSMNHYAENPIELWTKFNNIGYEKSSCILRMFQHAMTVPTFTKGLRHYFEKMYFKAAEPDDLYESLQWAYDEDFIGNDWEIRKLFDTWASQPGYPLVSVEKVENRLIFTQRRYPINYGEIYSISLTFSTKSSNNFDQTTPKVWMKGESMTINVDDANYRVNDWIILNNQQIGYYRADYSHEIWQAIIYQLVTDHEAIHKINRAVLVDELFLAWNDLGKVTAKEVLNAVTYLNDEDYHVTWSKSENILNFLHTQLFGTGVYQNFLNLLVHITKEHLSKQGLEGVENEASSIAMLRNFVRDWNCRGLDETCLNNELQKFLEYFNDGAANYFDFCHAMRNVDMTIYNQILDGISTNANFSSRNNYLNNLGCSMSEENLRHFLALSINSTNILSAAERGVVIASTCYRSPKALELCMEFMKENYQEINRIAPNQFNSILQSIAPYINTLEHADKLEALMSDLTRINAISSENLQSLKNVYISNIKWQASNFHSIEQWFDTWKGGEADNGGNNAFLSSIIIVLVAIVNLNVS